jgi:hypothetical protein
MCNLQYGMPARCQWAIYCTANAFALRKQHQIHFRSFKPLVLLPPQAAPFHYRIITLSHFLQNNLFVHDLGHFFIEVLYVFIFIGSKYAARGRYSIFYLQNIAFYL